ncbi:hypothetical protein NDU88_004815 [Pleurodeles waltl]|uniref:Uncharacterized protein n=1 Tax=Pleurodeles waltl TaxID=8319 RepID=A0AAV7RHA5_PLEWA|nr:hypothetical protein NDU88_004815 [Pleurodeles waltl]
MRRAALLPLEEERLAPKRDRGHGVTWAAAWAARRAFLRRLPGLGAGGAEGLEGSVWAPRAAGSQWGARPWDLRAPWVRGAPPHTGSDRGLEAGTPHPSAPLWDGG